MKVSSSLSSLCTERNECWQKTTAIKTDYVVTLLTWGPHWSDWGVCSVKGLLYQLPRLSVVLPRLAHCWNMSSVSVPPPKCLQKPLAIPHRHMFGPGPSNVPPRILEAGAKPVIGHMHPEIFEVTQFRYTCTLYDDFHHLHCAQKSNCSVLKTERSMLYVVVTTHYNNLLEIASCGK